MCIAVFFYMCHYEMDVWIEKVTVESTGLSDFA